MISDIFYDLETAADGSVSALPLPGGSIGDVLNGSLRLPARLAQLFGYILEDYGS